MARDDTSFAATLCERHRGWVVNQVGRGYVPVGWRDMIADAFADLAKIVGPTRYSLDFLEEEAGILRIGLYPTNMRSMERDPVFDAVYAMRERVGAASARTCQTCGRPGTLRRVLVPTTLCEGHFKEELEAIRAKRALFESLASQSTACETPVTERKPRRGRRRETPVVAAPATEAGRLALYKLSDVADALGARGTSKNPDTDHASFLQAILSKGEDARWRELAAPDHAQVTRLDELDRCAPHFGEVTNLVRRHLRAAIVMRTPTALPPLMLLGEPGFGKSWYVERLAGLLALPVRHHPMNSATAGDGLTGSNPIWRHARAGLVARTLLNERLANPVVLVDEFDKAMAHNGENPYRPFYTLLEPGSARTMVDEYLGFPVDASHVSWILAGNSTDRLPAPILDRLTVMTIPAMEAAHRRAVAASVYAEGNAARNGYFDPALADDVHDRLVDMTPRGMRRALGEAMVTAAAEGRRVLAPDDVTVDARPAKRRIGF